MEDDERITLTVTDAVQLQALVEDARKVYARQLDYWSRRRQSPAVKALTESLGRQVRVAESYIARLQ